MASMTGSEGAVLLLPEVNHFDGHTRFGDRAGRSRLDDAGDHVRWTGPGGDQSWTLPDQPGRPDLPVLTSVVYVDTQQYGPRGPIPARVLLLAGEDGATLATLGIASSAPLTSGPVGEDMDRVWPRHGFATLEARGVRVTTEFVDDFGRLNKVHRRAAGWKDVALYSKWSIRVLWLSIAALAAIMVAAPVLTR